MNTVEDDGLNAVELRCAQEQVHIRWLPINFRLEMRGFITQGNSKPVNSKDKANQLLYNRSSSVCERDYIILYTIAKDYAACPKASFLALCLD